MIGDLAALCPTGPGKREVRAADPTGLHRALRELAGDLDIHETVAAFHVQQAAETALKAAVSHAGEPPRRTHGVAEMPDARSDAGIERPSHADRFDELNPYAEESLRGLVDPAGGDRLAVDRMSGQAALPRRHLLVLTGFAASCHLISSRTGCYEHDSY